ncbi:MAG: hypothetical protein JNL38_35640, partial [Myxococcales bacterium]|nr:hypothetical protein [Myxococcales bacterium]
PRTREYFREVYSSYATGNYRSAVVMLWSVVICDLLFKLEDLKGRNDPAAVSIAAEVEAKQKASPRSPEWEELLVERLKERTHLLDASEHLNLKTIQQHRHLSAHPVLTTSTYELFSPNRETVRAHVRNALEGVLTKPALMSKKIFDAFTEDVERLGTVMPIADAEDADLRRYLDATYFNRLSAPVAEAIFRSLWRIVFKLADPRCETNREINYRALRLLYRRHAGTFAEAIRIDAGHYSDVALSGAPMRALVAFLADNPRVYSLLTDAARVPLKKHVESDDDQLAIAWFLSPDLRAHASMLLDKRRTPNTWFSVKGETFERLYAHARAEGAHAAVLDLGIDLYAGSGNFNQADERFKHMVAPHLEEYTAEQLKALLTGVERNTQTYWRSRAGEDHAKLKAACDLVLGAAFDYSAYPNFVGSLPESKPAA